MGNEASLKNALSEQESENLEPKKKMANIAQKRNVINMVAIIFGLLIVAGASSAVTYYLTTKNSSSTDTNVIEESGSEEDIEDNKQVEETLETEDDIEDKYEGWRTVKETSVGFKIKVPSDWEYWVENTPENEITQENNKELNIKKTGTIQFVSPKYDNVMRLSAGWGAHGICELYPFEDMKYLVNDLNEEMTRMGNKYNFNFCKDSRSPDVKTQYWLTRDWEDITEAEREAYYENYEFVMGFDVYGMVYEEDLDTIKKVFRSIEQL